ncbi:MAG: hypothetical protein QOF60_3179 [Actinomycetota bacterium]|jgi:hypothetical protein|nr:hypothetical protein [Actinomycetota bacterium]
MRAALAVAALLLPLSLGSGCGGRPPVAKADARGFTAAALRDAGLHDVKVRSGVSGCQVGRQAGWRTRADTAAGPVQLCVSRSELRALSVTDTGAGGRPLLDDGAFARLDRYRGRVPARRFVPALTGAVALLAAVGAITSYVWREEHRLP